MNTVLEDIRVKKADILRLSEQYHANNVRVFGSVARNESTDESDIDFLVSFLPNASLFDQVGLIESLSSLFHRKVDVISDRAINERLKTNILNEALPI